MKILECSSAGDKRFSAFYAKTYFDGVSKTIENHYQNSKVLEGGKKGNISNAKGIKPEHLQINNVKMDSKYLTPFYKVLWLSYLDSNPELVEYAKKYDDFNDIYKGKNTINCQSDVIRQYIKEGRESLVEDTAEFLEVYYLEKRIKNEGVI